MDMVWRCTRRTFISNSERLQVRLSKFSQFFLKRTCRMVLTNTKIKQRHVNHYLAVGGHLFIGYEGIYGIARAFTGTRAEIFLPPVPSLSTFSIRFLLRKICRSGQTKPRVWEFRRYRY